MNGSTGPYRNAQGQMVMGGNVISEADYALWQAANAQNQQTALGNVPMPMSAQPETTGQVPVHPQKQAEMDAIRALTARQNDWRNPITAGWEGLGALFSGR